MENQIVQNPTPEPTLTPVQVSEPRTKFSVIYLILSLLIFVLLASTVFLYYQNTQLKNTIASYQISALPTSTAYQSPVPSTIVFEERVAEWLTFIHLQENYSFKYPETWSVTESDNILVCPKDYKTNQENAKECFTITSDNRSFSKFISDIEKKYNHTISINSSIVRFSNDNTIYHLFNSGPAESRYSYTFIENSKLNKNIIVTSATAWDDYAYHLEGQIINTLKFTE